MAWYNPVSWFDSDEARRQSLMKKARVQADNLWQGIGAAAGLQNAPLHELKTSVAAAQALNDYQDKLAHAATVTNVQNRIAAGDVAAGRSGHFGLPTSRTTGGDPYVVGRITSVETRPDGSSHAAVASPTPAQQSGGLKTRADVLMAIHRAQEALARDRRAANDAATKAIMEMSGGAEALAALPVLEDGRRDMSKLAPHFYEVGRRVYEQHMAASRQTPRPEPENRFLVAPEGVGFALTDKTRLALSQPPPKDNSAVVKQIPTVVDAAVAQNRGQDSGSLASWSGGPSLQPFTPQPGTLANILREEIAEEFRKQVNKGLTGMSGGPEDNAHLVEEQEREMFLPKGLTTVKLKNRGAAEIPPPPEDGLTDMQTRLFEDNSHGGGIRQRLPEKYVTDAIAEFLKENPPRRDIAPETKARYDAIQRQWRRAQVPVPIEKGLINWLLGL